MIQLPEIMIALYLSYIGWVLAEAGLHSSLHMRKNYFFEQDYIITNILRGVVAFAHAMILSVFYKDYPQEALLFFFIKAPLLHWAFFEIPKNLMKGEKWNYLGNDHFSAKSDKFFVRFPSLWVISKILVVLAIIAVEFLTPKIYWGWL